MVLSSNGPVWLENLKACIFSAILKAILGDENGESFCHAWWLPDGSFMFRVQSTMPVPPVGVRTIDMFKRETTNCYRFLAVYPCGCRWKLCKPCDWAHSKTIHRIVNDGWIWTKSPAWGTCFGLKNWLKLTPMCLFLFEFLGDFDVLQKDLWFPGLSWNFLASTDVVGRWL